MEGTLKSEDIENNLATLVEWVNGQNQIPNFTDRRFLLSFLYTCKFDQDATRKRLKKYWTSRSSGIMTLMNNVNPSSSEILSVLRGPGAVYVPLPGVDKDGRKVIMAKWSQLDCSGESYIFDDWFRAVTVVFDALCMLDECAMEKGVTFLMDAEQVSLKHLKFFGFGNSMRQFSVMQKGYPIRIKKVHYVNNNAAIDVFFNTVKIVISTKLSERIKLHGHSFVPVYDSIGIDNLPEDYLPDDYEGTRAGTFQNIMENFIQNAILKPDNLRTLQELYSSVTPHPVSTGMTSTDNHAHTHHDSDSDDMEDIDDKIKDLKL